MKNESQIKDGELIFMKETLIKQFNAVGCFIGVSDKNNIKGITIGKETLNQWTKQISQSTDPRIIPELEGIRVDGNTVIAMKIKENPIKPISTKGKCLKRVDSSNRAIIGPKKQDVNNMVTFYTGNTC
ncbi:MAG: ATP-binding protein [ANME-2 cluster archaeon]|jgi:ATP-dependent DNA helicase RecG|nr:ATP-binding protein [ANME-2 cluster archaeon]